MSTVWYRPAHFYLLRAPVLPATTFLNLSHVGQIDHLGTDKLEQEWLHACQTSHVFLKQCMAHPIVQQALLVASPSLYAACQRLHPEEKYTRDHRTQRVYDRLLRYLIRMSSRPTPFGYCAGVAFGSFAPESHAILERCEGGGIRPDMRWLRTVLTEREISLLPALTVQVTPSLLTLGKRGIGFTSGKEDQRDERTWFTMTPVFQRLSHLARLPIAYADLKHLLLIDFPHATDEQVETFLHELYRIGVLVTTIQPTDEQDPLSHVLARVRLIANTAPVVLPLEAIQKAMQAPCSIAALSTLIQQQHALTPSFEGTTIQVDTRIHLHQNTLSSDIGLQAAHVAAILLRLGMHPYGLPSVHAAHRIFLERYGEQEVPLLTLFRPQSGFDTLYEREHDQSDLPLAQQEHLSRRAHLLRTLAMQAVNARETTLALTPDLVEQLSGWSLSTETPPPLLDLYMQVYADSPEAIDQGDWQGLATLLSLGGRSYQRFLHLFGEREQTWVRDVLQAGDALFPAHLCATLAVVPSNMRDLNVMHGPQWSAYVLPINCPSSRPPEQTITPDDILVRLQHGLFCLRSRAHNKAIRITQSHMLSFTHLPPLARFLLEASRDGEAFPGPFQWGQAGKLPFLPRLTWGKIILSLAQWTLSQEVLEDTGQEQQSISWFRVFQRWRERWRVPRYVYLIEGEDRLLLDLEHPLMADILRQEYVKMRKRKMGLTVQEALFHEKAWWLRDQQGYPYVSDIVIPLMRTTLSAQPSWYRAPSHDIDEQQRRFLPGQAWLYLKLYVPEELHTTLLAGPLSAFRERYRSLFDIWFFVRYHDPQAHIRLRFHTSNDHQGAALLQEVLAWSHTLQQEGLVCCMVDTYERETERYGGPEAISLIEGVFCANSEAVCALLAHQDKERAAPPLFVAVYALDRLWADWGYDIALCYQALQRLHPHSKESQTMRQQRPSLLAFLAHPPEHCCTIFDMQGPLLAQAGKAIHQLAEQKILCRTEEEILWSLSHMFCNRLLGTHHTDEQEVYAAWYATVKMRYYMAR